MTLVSSLHQKFTLGLQCRAERARKVFFLSCSFRLVAQFAVSPQFHSTPPCDSIVLMELDQPTRDRSHSILHEKKIWNAAFRNERGVNWVVACLCLLCINFQTVNLHAINISAFIWQNSRCVCIINSSESWKRSRFKKHLRTSTDETGLGISFFHDCQWNYFAFSFLR